MLLQSIKIGFNKGIKTLLFLSKIIIPVYIFVTILKYTPIMTAAGKIFSPFMRLFNLPGEAAIPFISGVFLDEYGAIAAMKVIKLTDWQITTIAIMVLFFHTIFIESALLKKMGLSISFFTLFRFALVIVFGILVGQLGGIL